MVGAAEIFVKLSCNDITQTVAQPGTGAFIVGAALADRACAEKALDRFGKRAFPFVLQAGYPSLLLDKPDDAELLRILHVSLVEGGDRYLVRDDPAILESLKTLGRRAHDAEDRARAEELFDVSLGAIPEAYIETNTPIERLRYVLRARLDRLSADERVANSVLR